MEPRLTCTGMMGGGKSGGGHSCEAVSLPEEQELVRLLSELLNMRNVKSERL